MILISGQIRVQIDKTFKAKNDKSDVFYTISVVITLGGMTIISWGEIH